MNPELLILCKSKAAAEESAKAHRNFFNIPGESVTATLQVFYLVRVLQENGKPFTPDQLEAVADHTQDLDQLYVNDSLLIEDVFE